MLGRQNALAVDGGDHRGTQSLDQFARLGGGVLRATAQYHQRALGSAQQLGGTDHDGRIGNGAVGDLHCSAVQVVGRRGDHVQRQFDVHRPRPGAVEHREGTGQHLRQLVGAQQGVAEGGQASAQRALVRQFVQPSTAHT